MTQSIFYLDDIYGISRDLPLNYVEREYVDDTFFITTLIISKKPGNTGISRDIRTEFTTDLLLSD